jgi:Tol biopolymer transport system component
MLLTTGARLGPYEIVAPLGAGGMGEVYRARDTRLDRTVAIKILAAGIADDPQRQDRFRREARAISSLTHAHICTLHDIGEQDGVEFLVMEYLAGETLAHRLLRGPLPVDEVVRIGAQLADALDAAHQQSVTHRDLKPANVMLTPTGAKILDFGLAKLTSGGSDHIASGAAGTDPTLTVPGAVVGTIQYMAPEQVEGKPADARSDLFALGAIMYEMATGRKAFEGTSAQSVMAAILTSMPPPMASVKPAIPPALERLVRGCLEKDRARRWQSARDLANQVRWIAEERSERGGRRSALDRRHRAVLGWGLAIAVVLSIAAVSWLRRSWAIVAPSPLNLTFTQLTTQSGIEQAPSISPDGKWVVYEGDQTGNADLYLQSVNGHNPINLTEDSRDDDTQPAFSPDGDSIAFRSERQGGGIFVMGRTGESVRRIADSGYNPAWAPDGSQLVFATDASGPLGRSHISELWTVTMATGDKRRITEGDAVQASWSPHGFRVAYWAMVFKGPRQGQRDIWTMPAGGGPAIPVTSDPALDWNPVWSADGRYLYFCSDRGGSMNLWRVPMEERTGKVLGQPEAITAPSPFARHMSVSADGRLVAYASLLRTGTIQRVAFDPVAAAIIDTPVTVLGGSRSLSAPAPSPDGKWLAFYSGDGQLDILISRPDGRSVRQLTNDRAYDRNPRWSPDGQRIAFFSNRGGTYQIWSIKPDGSGLRQLTEDPEGVSSYNVWSPDGSRMVFAEQGKESSRIIVFDVDKPWKDQTLQVLPHLTETGVNVVPYSWSPDGGQLAGVGDYGGGVFVYSLTTGRFTRLSDVGDSPIWLKDGRRLLFVDSRGGLFVVDTVSKAVRESLSIAPDIFERPALTADNRTLYFTRASAQGDIWLLRFK